MSAQVPAVRRSRGTSDRLELFLASRNAKKLAEMERILRQHLTSVAVLGLDDVAPYDEPVEDQPTFEGNALLKARAGPGRTPGCRRSPTTPGLCVDALNGMPGVLSARWSGPPKSDDRNNSLLLAQLEDVPDDRRGAHFTCAVAFCAPGVDELVVEGRMDGRIIRETRGSGGFGYDVLFVADDHPGRPPPSSRSRRRTRSATAARRSERLAPLVARSLGSGG